MSNITLGKLENLRQLIQTYLNDGIGKTNLILSWLKEFKDGLKAFNSKIEIKYIIKGETKK